MKKIFSVIFIFVMTVSLCSCSDVYHETMVSDIELYDTIWNLPERRIAETSLLFPATVEKEQVVNFHCKHTTYQLVGTGWQVELSVKYQDDLFDAEKERLNEICKNSTVCGDSAYFDIPAYATVWNWNCCFEYAVVNEDAHTIGYIYLQLINKKDLTVTDCYIPQPYEMELSDTQGYSVYP